MFIYPKQDKELSIMASPKGRVYLFPSQLSVAVPVASVVPAGNIELIRQVKYFVVEELRTARRFLKACDKSIDINSLHFEILNEHTPATEVASFLAPAIEGNDIGVISEAGCPAVADPGADLVAAAQRAGIEVVPLVGPSSILLGLMGSGFNGQSFTFRGYLPIDASKRTSTFKEMLSEINRQRRTQIFIETPYRNNRLIAELVRTLPGQTLLCVASDITGPEQSIITRPLSKWAIAQYNYDKKPTIFLLN